MENLALTSWIALTIGFVHALEPGHGKTALFAYLASGKKTWKEGLVISFSSALTHSLAVLFIAFISHFLLHQTVNENNIHSLTHYLNYTRVNRCCDRDYSMPYSYCCLSWWSFNW